MLAVAVGLSAPARADFFDDLSKVGEGVERLLDSLPEAEPEAPTQQPKPAEPQSEPAAAPPPGPGEVQPASQPAAAPQTEPQKELQTTAPTYNADAEKVARAQLILNQLGYDAGPVDGAYGGRTRGAIVRFELDRSLPALGNVTDPLIARLEQESAARGLAVTSPASGAATPDGDLTRASVGQTGSTGAVTVPVAAAAPQPSAALDDGPFAGITVIRLEGEEASPAIAGDYARAPMQRQPHLVVFVSPEGSYASITPFRSPRSCVAWSAAGVQENRWITFGIKHADYEGQSSLAAWCQPFTLYWTGDGKVRLVAQNEVTPFGRKQATETRLLSHDGVHDIVARVPLTPPRFDLPVFETAALHGVPLGPTAPGEGEPRIAIGALKSSPLGAFKQLSADFERFPGLAHGGTVRGEVAAAEVTGWPSDALVTAFVQERLPERIDAQALADRFIARLGTPTMEGERAELLWLHDMEGRLLVPGDAAVDNCLPTTEMWRASSYSMASLEDHGPWGCSLLVWLTIPGALVEYLPGEPRVRVLTRQVNEYRLETVAGHAVAVSHFQSRLAELEEARAQLGVAAEDGAREVIVVRGAEAVMADATTPPGPDGFDVLAPAGIAIGMTHAEAEAALSSAGFRARQIDSAYVAEYDRGSVVVELGTDASTFTQWPPLGLVSSVSYRLKSLDPSGPAAPIVEGATARLGTNPDCAALEEGLALCSWEWPAAAPLVRTVNLSFKPIRVQGLREEGQGYELHVHLQATAELGASVAAGAAPAATGTESSAGGTTGAATAGRLDPLKPEGVAIGMALWQAEDALKAAGYKGLRCEFLGGGGGASMTFEVVSGPYGGTDCDPEAPIRRIHFTASGLKVADSVLDVIDSMKSRLGAEPQCKSLTEHEASCVWLSPPASPLLEQVLVQVSKSYWYLELTAIRDLAAKVTIAPAPAQPHQETWWERDLAAAEAEAATMVFAPGGQHAALAPEVRSQIGAEGRTVYEYCKGRQTFAAFHDCRCVAERLMEVRALAAADDPLPPANESELVGMADKVADQCPNKPGVAAFGYENCVGMYSSRLQDAVGPFCTCYADRFATFYMEDPRSHMSNVKKRGVAALTVCSEEVTPNPFSE